MNVSLTPRWEKFIQAKIKSGRYHSASEVVRDSLRLLEVQDRVRAWRTEDLRQEIEKGLGDIRKGRYKTYTEETLRDLLEKVKSDGRKKLTVRRKAHRQ